MDKANKRRLLQYLLEDPSLTSVLVFTRTKHGADQVARDLVRAGIPAKAIHGNKSQNARQLALKEFKGACASGAGGYGYCRPGNRYQRIALCRKFRSAGRRRLTSTALAGRDGRDASGPPFPFVILPRAVAARHRKAAGASGGGGDRASLPRQVLEVPPKEPRSAPPAPHKKAAPVKSASSVSGEGRRSGENAAGEENRRGTEGGPLTGFSGAILIWTAPCWIPWGVGGDRRRLFW